LMSLGKLARLAVKMSRFKDTASDTLRTGPPPTKLAPCASARSAKSLAFTCAHLFWEYSAS